MSDKSAWTDDKKALLALLILCDEADDREAEEQFPGPSHRLKRRAAEWLASRITA